MKMASKSDFESLDEEIRELLLNYKFKKETVYEPCTHENIKECLIGLHEEFDLLNINYVFNPYCDMVGTTLHPEALVKLINSIWTLLRYHKTNSEKVNKLVEENYVLEQANKQLNGLVGKLKEDVYTEKNKARTCIASAQRISDNSDELIQSLAESNTKLIRLSKQKESLEKSLLNEITRLKSENIKLTDRLRAKSGTFTSCTESCHSTLMHLKEQERKHRTTIAKLQLNGQTLLKEVVALKEKIILNGSD